MSGFFFLKGLSGCSVQNELGIGKASEQRDLLGGFSVAQKRGNGERRLGGNSRQSSRKKIQTW
jgi:hypothetical protein